MGDNHLLVAGGVLDQPIRLLLDVREARYLWGIIERHFRQSATERMKDTSLTASDERELDKLEAIRDRLLNDELARLGPGGRIEY